jgi:hypothetical protein
MAHRNARLTQFGRLLLVQRITELGWPPAQAAESLGSRGPRPTSGSAATTLKAQRAWLTGARDPAAVPCPHRQPGPSGAGGPAPPPGPHRLAWQLGMARSTVSGVLRRHGMSRLAQLDRPSGAVVRYQREWPGELVHLDVKQLGRIPDGDGHRIHGRADGPGPRHRLRLPPLGRG